MSLKVAIYARVSTTRDAQKDSIDNQIAYAMDLITRNGWTVAGTYIDNGISGLRVKNRAQMQRLLADAKKKKFDAVIAKSASRLGRNLVENLQTADIIVSSKVRLILPEDNFDSATSQSKFNFNIRALLAEEDSATFSRRIKLGRQGSAKRGKYQASLPAYGYRRDENGNLVPDEETAPTVQSIFHWYLHDGWGMQKISNYLTEHGYPTPRTVSNAGNQGTVWHQSSIKCILTNETYTGTLCQHREEVVSLMSKERVKIPKDKQIIFENAHPALISKEDYEAVQELMKSKGKNHSNGQESLFAHLMMCPDCGHGMTFRKDRLKKQNGAYVCCGYVKRGKSFCSSHIIGYDTLLAAVKNDLKELISSNVKLDRLFDAVKGNVGLKQTALIKELHKLNKKLEQLERDVQGLITLFSNQAVTLELFTAQNERIQTEQQAIAKRKAELESILEAQKDTEEQFRAFQKQIASFTRLDIDDEQVLKQLLHQVIQKIEVNQDGSIRRIHYNIAHPQGLGDLSQGA
ncbi:recombinase family protein [Brevibacillus panacihumi]|uniref:recombinase family protein n=1 Tax=Brevibacillus panacihumi TaxID=497735 RepID=UPI003CFBE31A